MTFEQLEYFIAVAESDTFFDAADSLHTTQSTLSKQIIKLEKELNVQLLDRTKRSASLTEAGKIFYQESLGLFEHYRKVLLRMKECQTQKEQSIRIGTLPILAQYHLSSLFKEFTERHPEINLIMDEVEESELMTGMSQGKYDLIIVRKPMLDAKEFSCLLLAEDSLAAIFPENHPLAQKTCVSVTDLAEERFILMKPYTCIYQICMKLFQQEAMNPHVIRTARLESIISAVSVGDGISLLPTGNFNLFHHEHLAAVKLEPSPALSVVIASKKARKLSPAAKCFLMHVSDCMKKNPALQDSPPQCDPVRRAFYI